jgi:hypothetical protein
MTHRAMQVLHADIQGGWPMGRRIRPPIAARVRVSVARQVGPHDLTVRPFRQNEKRCPDSSQRGLWREKRVARQNKNCC